MQLSTATNMFSGKLTDQELTRLQGSADADSLYVIVFKQRTAAQNKFFRAICQKLATQVDGSVQYWHDLLVERYIGFEEVVTEDGCVRRILPSTSTLSVGQFAALLTASLNFAASQHVHFEQKKLPGDLCA